MAQTDKYEIFVQRITPGYGYLWCKVNGQTLLKKVDCFEDARQRLKAKKYTKCAATHMGNGMRAIWIQGPYFVHSGTKPSHSKGCFVAPARYINAIWDAIEPKEVTFVSVTVLNNVGPDEDHME